MKKVVILTIFSAVLCLAYGATVDLPKDLPPEPIPSPKPPKPDNNSTTAAPTTTPSPPPTTQPPTPEPTTKPTTTTTAAPNTTTAATTTAATTTAGTTTAAPTSKPTPKPKPEAHTWYANTTDTNKICIALKMILEVEVPYETKDNKPANATITVPPTANATGECAPNATEQSLILTWSLKANISNNVVFTFKKDNTKFTVHSVVATIVPDATHFPNASNNDVIIANHTKDEFPTPVAMSYRCKQEEYLTAPIGVNRTGTFIISNLQVQAFRDSTSEDFDSAKDCEAGETPGIVPIAVGCSLAALIIIVLIAYLVGRRRSQARGYLSMFSEKQREEEYIPMKNISCFGK